MAGTESGVLERFGTVFSLAAIAPERLAMLETIDHETATTLIRSIYREYKNNPLSNAGLERLFARVESSEFPLSLWIGQIVQVYGWLEVQNSTAHFSDVVEYVSCSIHGSSSQQGQGVSWYLDHYGFEKQIVLK